MTEVRSQVLTPLVAAVLDSFTPVDRSILGDLEQHVAAAHVDDLVKRLCTAAETAAPGTGAERMLAALAGDDADDALREIDALLEFGASWSELDDAQRAQAARAEIRQEIQHFDRIMDLDTLTSGRRLKRRRDFVADAGLLGAAERTLVLVSERMVLHGRAVATWSDLAHQPQRNISGPVLRRTSAPYVSAVTDADDMQDAAETLARFEGYALRHPLAVSVALLDIDRFQQRRIRCPFAAAALHFGDGDGDRARAEVWIAGAASLLVLERDGYLTHVVSTLTAASDPLGGPHASYRRLEVDLGPDQCLAIALDGGTIAAHGNLESALNAPNRAGRVLLHDNLRRLGGDRPICVVKDAGARRTRARSESLRDTPAPDRIARELIDGTRALTAAIECGHVHSDREVGPAQLRGLELGRDIVRLVEDVAAAEDVACAFAITPMVDDDHVLNRLSYAGYSQLFEAHGIRPDDLILESSPIVRAVAHDMLRRAVAREGREYRLERFGDNLYLTAGDMRVELIEDLEGEMRNGCVLFETALIAYRCAREAVTEAFWRDTGHTPFALHVAMAEGYDAADNPQERETVRAHFNALYVDPWEEVQASLDRTPYVDGFLDTLTTARQDGCRLIALNVLEDYYAPQQRKVLRLAELLGVPLPLYTVFFSPHGRGLSTLNAMDGSA